jgi:hypothetical protein
MKSAIARVMLSSLFLVNYVSIATATIIGGGTSVPGAAGLDGTQGRDIVDITTTASLPAGTYQATLFDALIRADLASDAKATPFLAIVSSTPGSTGNGTSSDLFKIIAVGAEQTYDGSSTGLQSRAFGGSNTFTLTGTTTVYAGFASNPATLNPVTGIGTGSYGIDLWSVVGSAYYTPVVGNDTVTLASGGDRAAGFGRQYAFDIQVNPVPEPSGMVLLLIGFAGLGFRRRRSSVVC